MLEVAGQVAGEVVKKKQTFIDCPQMTPDRQAKQFSPPLSQTCVPALCPSQSLTFT